MAAPSRLSVPLGGAGISGGRCASTSTVDKLLPASGGNGADSFMALVLVSLDRDGCPGAESCNDTIELARESCSRTVTVLDL